MAYATVADVQARMSRQMSVDEQNICSNLLDDAAVIIDSYNENAPAANKKLVSIRMVIRSMNVDSDIPIGATQGSQSALGYVQSWTMGTNASTGELYLGRTDKKLLGVGDAIGASNPLSFVTAKRDNE